MIKIRKYCGIVKNVIGILFWPQITQITQIFTDVSLCILSHQLHECSRIIEFVFGHKLHRFSQMLHYAFLGTNYTNVHELMNLFFGNRFSQKLRYEILATPKESLGQITQMFRRCFASLF